MYHRQNTPPGTIAQDVFQPGSATSVHSRTASDGSFMSQDISPVSVQTHLTTPERSPIRLYGPMLLPKPRAERELEPKAGPIRSHRRTISTSSNHGHGWAPYSQRPSLDRRGTSPSQQSTLMSSSSAATSPIEAPINSALNSPLSFSGQARRPSLGPHSRSTSATNVHPHSRSGSTSSIDEETLSRFGFPTYRPSYLSGGSNGPSAHALSHLTPLTSSAQPSIPAPTALSHLNPLRSVTPQPPIAECPMAMDMNFDATAPTTTLLDYLTAPNPAPALVSRIYDSSLRPQHFWWDIRNVRPWDDFNVSTMCGIPSLLPLLNAAVSSEMLPPSKRFYGHPTPETETHLQDIWREHHAHIVNAALGVALGEHHIRMRSQKIASNPEFISNYAQDSDFQGSQTILLGGNELPTSRRGCVVGLVKAYNRWNSNMRTETPNRQVEYLKGLAHLHRFMREHGTRYGFLMTEVELVCVRYGGDRDARNAFEQERGVVGGGEDTPLFGYLENTAPGVVGANVSNGEDIQMTASLALWYLHMLAKEAPLQGQLGWKLDIGTPQALTRQMCLEKDKWIPTPQKSEMREASRNRGWVMPTEPLCRQERAAAKGRRR
ncbi:hypothetical protein EV356DRAFT_442895 [Viridothelium virens]|uniref:Sialidase n=1 Tax=Viridothelium virens TaxID=1048519 RepID=A0A6A6HG86_VIRVR|nr:hypothetical protein EV356DRAFT_442895 [Viridothelium virens]